MEDHPIEVPEAGVPSQAAEPTTQESAGALMDRAFKAAVLGLMVWPVEFYAFVLLTRAFLDAKEPHSPQREKAIQTLVMSLPLVLLQVFLLWTVVSAALNFFLSQDISFPRSVSLVSFLGP